MRKHIPTVLTVVAFSLVAFAAKREPDWPVVKPEVWKAKAPSAAATTVAADCIGTMAPEIVHAGERLRVTWRFKGQAPCLPLEGELRWFAGDDQVKVERRVFREGEVTRGANDVWSLTAFASAPWHLSAGKLSLAIFSDSIKPTFGQPPKVYFDFVPAKCLPGFEMPPKVRVEQTDDGSSHFVLNGKPYAMAGGYSRPRDRADGIPKMSDAHVNFVTVDMPYWEFYPRCGVINTNALDKWAEMQGSAHPKAYFLVWLSVFPPSEWRLKGHMDDMCQNNLGEANHCMNYSWCNWSFASKDGLEAVKWGMREAMKYLESSPYANRIIGYSLNSGNTIEWLGWDVSDPKADELDFSPVAKKAYRQWAAIHYPEISDPHVPSRKERRRAMEETGILWNQRRNLNTIAYFEFYSDMVAQDLISCCRMGKEIVHGDKLIGTYYGYTMTLQASGCSQMRAHYDLKRVLDSGAVDYLMSPQPYRIRDLGFPCGEMKPFASMAARGIVPFIENDTRTHNGLQMGDGHLQTLTEYQTVNILRRDMGFAICRNEPLDIGSYSRGTYLDFPAYGRDFTHAAAAARHALEAKTRRDAEIALVISEKTLTAMPVIGDWGEVDHDLQTYRADGTVSRKLNKHIIYTANVYETDYLLYSQLGAPVDYVLLEDLGNLKRDYKLYVFPNALKYDAKVLAHIRELQKKNCVILWLFAPGYMKDMDESTEFMRELSGFTFAERPGTVAAAAKLNDGSMLGAPKVKMSPMFAVTDADKLLGRYEDGSVAVGMKKVGNSTSVFSGPWQMNVDFLSSVADMAGVHIYARTEDPVEANERFVVLHARFPGRKTITLKRPTDVYDVFNRRLVAKNAREFSFDALLHSSWLFYCADDAERVFGIGDAAEGDVELNACNSFGGGKLVNCKYAYGRDGIKFLDSGKPDPRLHVSGLDLDTASIGSISYRYRAKGLRTGGKGRLFFTQKGDPFDGKNCFVLPDVVADGEWHTVTLMTDKAIAPQAWKAAGRVFSIRFDPAYSMEGEYELSFMRFDTYRGLKH